MTPIEKTRAEEYALQVLRVRRQANHDEIRTAWRRRIVETHPDRNAGDSSQFQIVQAAYEVAQGKATDDAMTMLVDAAQLGEPAASAETRGQSQRNPRRARVKTRLVFFDQQEAPRRPSAKPRNAEAVELDGSALQHVEGAVAHIDANTGEPRDEHKLQRVRQKGRRVTYIIWNSVKEGSNKVSLPKGDFRRAGECHEIALQFASDAEGAATVTIPEEQRLAHFPGAQSVRVHFAHGADKRPDH